MLLQSFLYRSVHIHLRRGVLLTSLITTKKLLANEHCYTKINLHFEKLMSVILASEGREQLNLYLKQRS